MFINFLSGSVLIVTAMLEVHFRISYPDFTPKNRKTIKKKTKTGNRKSIKAILVSGFRP